MIWLYKNKKTGLLVWSRKDILSFGRKNFKNWTLISYFSPLFYKSIIKGDKNNV